MTKMFLTATLDSWLAGFYFLIVASTTEGQFSTGVPDGVRSGEFCNKEKFSPRCSQGQVILMRSALYGRMKRTECTPNDYGHIGCYVDALRIVDEACSGRQACDFMASDSIPNEIQGPQACPVDIMRYMAASYQCIPVVSGKIADCQRHRRLKVNLAEHGYLSSLQAENRLGTADCPWHLHAKQGQKVIFYLYNFTPDPQTANGHSGDQCYKLATIYEKAGESFSLTTCHAKQKRGMIVHVSQSHDVRVEMESSVATIGKFLIRYEVTGCADITPPSNSTMTKDGNMVEVKCTNSQETWTLICKDRQWIGKLGNCSTETNSKSGIGRMFGEEKFPYGILIVVAIGVALGVFCGGLLLTCAAMYMKRRRQERARLSMQPHVDMDDHATEDRIRMRVDDVTLIHKQYSPYMANDDVTRLQCCDDMCLQNIENAKYKTGFTIKTTKETPMKAIGTYPRTHVYESPRLV